MSRPPNTQFYGWRHHTSPYDILGISRSASQAEIRKAYKKRALETHPDKQYQFGATAEEGLIAEELFRQVLEAFDLLNDQNKRRAYDIHSRPPPKPLPRADRTPSTDARSSRETNTPGSAPVDYTHRKSPSTHDTPRTQERAEWVRKEEAGHKAWKNERTKSFSTPSPEPAPTPVPPPSRSKSHDSRSRASSFKESTKQPKKEPPPPDYNEWADRILAELYHMMPELTAKTKSAPQRDAGVPPKMRTNPA